MDIETTLSFGPDEYLTLPDDKENPGEKDLLLIALEALHKKPGTGLRIVILKKSIDARKKNRILLTFRVRITDTKLEKEPISTAVPEIPEINVRKRPVVVGFGPAGMFAALLLSREGHSPLVIERGNKIEDRVRDVERYFGGQALLPYSNVQFGEGGAGTFSDGKLYSGVSDTRRTYVLDSFVRAGAPREILYASHPHVGTDRLRGVVTAIRREIESAGGTFLFGRTVNGIETENGRVKGIRHLASDGTSRDSGDSEFLETENVILAIGHSARDTFRYLNEKGISMTAKPFSVGVRIEHPREWIDRAQYGNFAGHKALSAAEYKLVAHTDNGRALYTFCMCPGGYVVAGASETNGVVTNGMSNYKRDAENSNSAILVGCDIRDFEDRGVLSGVYFQQRLERLAFEKGGKTGKAPCQRLGDFLEDRASLFCGEVKPSYRPGVTYTNLRRILPDFVSETISLGISSMNRSIPGFSHPDSLLTGVETRSSSPVRIARNEELMSPDAEGLFPCGEGAGYAGGIMSSAIDGLKCAEKVVERLSGFM